MSLTAIARGIHLQEDDCILAVADGEVRGQAVVGADSVLYLSISGETPEPLYFVVQRNGGIVAESAHGLDFRPDAICGSPSLPTEIDFQSPDPSAPSHAFSLQGIRLNSIPQRKGVYIIDGRKRVIK